MEGAPAPPELGQYFERVAGFVDFAGPRSTNKQSQYQRPQETNMARQRTTFRSSKSIAGAALAGVGMFVLYENLAAAVAWLSHVRHEATGVVPAVILGVYQVMQAHAADPPRFLQGFPRHMLVLFWPLLLVIVGTVLSRDTIADKFDEHAKKDCRAVDLAAYRSTLK